MKFNIPVNVTRGMHRAAFKIKKHSPEILAVTGVIGIATSFVMACKATTKLNPILEETQRNIDAVHTAVATGVAHTMDPETQEIIEVPYAPEDGKKDLTIYTAKGGLKVVKLYAPAVTVGLFAVGCMLGSNHMLRKRYLASAAAYTAVDTAFKDYRGRVIERFGEALDRELKYGVKAIEVTEEVTNPKTGKTKTVTKTVEALDPNNRSLYTFVFDETCKGWERDARFNFTFLQQTQAYWNNRLQTVGHVFLNEVLDDLGIPRCKMGNIVGWYFNEKDPIGDNFIDFGLFDIQDENKRMFVNGYEKSVWLDFNCDGNILELLP